MFWGARGVGKRAVESATPTYARPSTSLDPPPGTSGTRVRAQKLQPRATGSGLPVGPGHQAHPPLPGPAALFESPAPGSPPAAGLRSGYYLAMQPLPQQRCTDRTQSATYPPGPAQHSPESFLYSEVSLASLPMPELNQDAEAGLRAPGQSEETQSTSRRI